MTTTSHAKLPRRRAAAPRATKATSSDAPSAEVIALREEVSALKQRCAELEADNAALNNRIDNMYQLAVRRSARHCR